MIYRGINPLKVNTLNFSKYLLTLLKEVLSSTLHYWNYLKCTKEAFTEGSELCRLINQFFIELIYVDITILQSAKTNIKNLIPEYILRLVLYSSNLKSNSTGWATRPIIFFLTASILSISKRKTCFVKGSWNV